MYSKKKSALLFCLCLLLSLTALHGVHASATDYVFTEGKISDSQSENSLGVLANTYTLTVQQWSRTDIYDIGYSAGDRQVIRADNPPEAGMYFDKWILVSGSGSFEDESADTTGFIFGDSDAVVKPTYRYPNTYNVRYYNGSTLLKTETLLEGTAINGQYAPVVEGHYQNWFTAPVGGVQVTIVTQDQSLYVRYIPYTYEVRYYVDGTWFSTTYGPYGSELISAPGKPGYVFLGWRIGGQDSRYVTFVGGSWTLHAEYAQIGTYSTKYYDGTTLLRTVTANAGSLHPDSYAPKKAGMTFLGWYSEPAGGIHVEKVSSNQSVYARYVTSKYDVNYYNGSTLIKTTTVSHNINAMVGPAKTGYTFLGWFTAQTGGTKVTKITKSQNLYARYSLNKYTLHYYDGTKLIKKVNKSYGASLTDATTYANAPKKPGKTFIGWYSSATGGAQVKKVPAKNVKLYARYQNIQYNVKYYDHNNTLITSTTQTYNSDVKAGPARTGYTFVGWYNPSGVKITKITANRNLSAKYTISKYAVHYYDGSTLLKMTTKSYGASLTDTVTFANAPKKAGKIFIGWYSSASSGAQVTKMPAKNIKLYARYETNTDIGSRVLDIAALYIGVPYVWGGTSPAGFDCSGLVVYCYAQLGFYLPRTTYGMMEYGSYVAYGDLRPGDLVITSGGGHVGLYVGGGTMIHAPMPGYSVCYAPIYDFFMGRRP